MAVTPNYDLDIDSTLGGDNASDYVIPSQKAIKSYVDNSTGSTVDQVYDPTSQAAQSGIAIAGANFLTSSDLADYVTTNTDQNITGVKTYVGQKRIGFKQSGSNDKLGFTLYNSSNVEKGYLEFNPTNTIDGAPLMTLGNYASSAAAITHVGFRKYSSVSGASGAYNLLAPLISDAKTPFNLTTTYTNFYLPLGFTNGTNTVLTAKTGVVDISSLLPTVPTVDQVYDGTSTNPQSGVAIAGAGFLTSIPSTYLQNTETSTNAIGILSYPSFHDYSESVVIGYHSTNSGNYGVAIGSKAKINDSYGIAIGYNSSANYSSIQLGYGTNSDRTLKVGFFRGTDNQSHNWELLNGTTGLIPDERLSSNIARTSAIPTALSDLTVSAGSNITISGDTISATDTTYSDFTGADSVTSGANGLVPAPSAGDEDKILTGGATWSALKTINNTSLLGSGNIDTSEIFVAEFSTTTYADVLAQYNAGKSIFTKVQAYGKKFFIALSEVGQNVFYFVTSFVSPLIGNDNCIYTFTLNASGWDYSVKSYAKNDLSNLSATGEAKFDAKVNKSGDTMTGALEIDYASATDDSAIIVKSSNLEIDVAPSEAVYPPLIAMHDKNGVRIGQVEIQQTNATSHSIAFSVRKNGTDAEPSYSSICVGWDGDGNRFSTAVTPSSVTSNSTNIATTAHIINVLKAIYPVGAIFMGTTSTCPMAQFFGTWALVAQDRVLQGSSTNHSANDTINASLPTLTAASNGDHSHNRGTMNITGSFNFKEGHGKLLGVNNATDCFSGASSGAITNPDGGGDTVSGGNRTVKLNASDKWSGSTNSTGAHTHSVTWTNHVGTTVQPSAYVVNVWRRTA